MKMRSPLPTTLLAAGLLALGATLLIPGTVDATTPVGTTGLEGEVYLVQAGTAAELLPYAEPDDDRMILGLEILRPGEDPEWIEIPQSEGVRADASHFALFEEASNTLFVVWQTRIGSHPVIKLASFQDGVWGEVIPVSDDVWTFKGSPQLAVTRDTFKLDRDGEIETVERTFLHVLWWEETIDGVRVLYRPLILESGHLKGMGDLFVLNELVDLSAAGSGEAGPAVQPTRPLLESPVLQPGRDSSSVLTAFADARSGRLVVAEIRLLPMGLGEWADEIHQFVSDQTAAQPEPRETQEIQSLADVIRSHIVIAGQRHRLNPRAVREIAVEVHQGIVNGGLGAASASGGSEKGESGSGDALSSLSDVIRSHIVIAGARIDGETLDRFSVASAPSVLEVVPEGLGSSDRGKIDTPHLARTVVSNSLPVPDLGEAVLPHLFVSPDGTDVAVAWEEPGTLAYRKSEAGGWSEVRRMGLSEELTLDDALQILDRSVRPHR